MKLKMKTTCSKCDKPIEQNRLLCMQRYCKNCHAENMRNNRPKYYELTEEQRKKANARAYVKVYISRGKIIKQPCKICGNKNTEMHHEDYDRPLCVDWFCRKHHLELHNKKPAHVKT